MSPPLKVLVLAPYPLRRAPSQRFRWEQYLSPLAERDILLEPSNLLDEEAMDIIHANGAWGPKLRAVGAGAARRIRDAVRCRRFDLVLVHRESFPFGPAWFERLLATTGVPYAFDFDDAVFLPNASAANRRLAGLKSAGKTRGVVASASLVLAGNDYLAEWASAYNPRVTVIPTTIDADHYQPRAREPASELRIGWSGSMSTIAHLRPIEPVLRTLQQERGIRIRVIGEPSYRLPGAHLESIAWHEQTEIEDLQPIDIGVMPLPDNDWARGKCGLKALQYMALGIPTVLSPVGVNNRIASGGAAILASTLEDWYAALTRLLDNPSLRAEVGGRGRRKVEQEYSVTAVLPLWERALRQAAGHTD